MVQVSLHWSKHGADNLVLWGFTVKHAVRFCNCIPNCLIGHTPMELLTNTKANHCYLLCTNVWGCPFYILDPLQDGQKIPR
ncbi:hypothetical protein ACHAXS_000246 [Conticribra weissflogii]